jgi:hypothetical protein
MGNSKNAPDTPPIDVKKEITKAIPTGMRGCNSISAIGKIIPKLNSLLLLVTKV